MTTLTFGAWSLHIIAEGTAAATGDEFFRSLARCAAQALGARYAFVAETLTEMESRSLAFWDGSDFGVGSPIVFRARPASGLRRVTSALDRIEELSSFGPVD